VEKSWRRQVRPAITRYRHESVFSAANNPHPGSPAPYPGRPVGGSRDPEQGLEATAPHWAKQQRTNTRQKWMGSVFAEAACEKMHKAFPRKRHGCDEAGPRRSEPHVRPMLFAGRSLSGFVCAEPAGSAADDAASGWIVGLLVDASAAVVRRPRARAERGVRLGEHLVLLRDRGVAEVVRVAAGCGPGGRGELVQAIVPGRVHHLTVAA